MTAWVCACGSERSFWQALDFASAICSNSGFTGVAWLKIDTDTLTL